MNYGATRQYLQSRFGGAIAETQQVITTGAAPVVAADNDPDALGMVLVNLGLNIVYVGLEGSVGAANGIAIAASGGYRSFTIDQDMTLVGRRWYAISPTGASTLYVLRVRRDTTV